MSGSQFEKYKGTEYIEPYKLWQELTGEVHTCTGRSRGQID